MFLKTAFFFSTTKTKLLSFQFTYRFFCNVKKIDIISFKLDAALHPKGYTKIETKTNDKGNTTLKKIKKVRKIIKYRRNKIKLFLPFFFKTPCLQSETYCSKGEFVFHFLFIFQYIGFQLQTTKEPFKNLTWKGGRDVAKKGG